MPLDARLPPKFRNKIDPQPSGCWLWLGYKDPAGYGRVTVPGRTAVRVHRLAYELLVGPIAAGFELDHTCRTRCCANPAHLEAVAHRTNQRMLIRLAPKRTNQDENQ
jgi:hypothetical protein